MVVAEVNKVRRGSWFNELSETPPSSQGSHRPSVKGKGKGVQADHVEEEEEEEAWHGIHGKQASNKCMALLRVASSCMRAYHHAWGKSRAKKKITRCE